MPDGGTLRIDTMNAELDGIIGPDRGAHIAGPYVMLAVTDTGVGMDAETKARIYEPFYSTKGDKGTGLGLATVYGIVKQSGGEIWVYSEPGRGTTFKVYLPRLSDTTTVRKSTERLAQNAGGSETILLAEDDDAVRNLARRVLEHAGYRVLPADNGAEALRVSKEHEGTIHLLVTDMVMPGMSGTQLAERLRDTRPALRVLYLSGYTDAAVLRTGMLSASEQFLQKPFSPQAFGLKVREVLDSDDAGAASAG
jgi:CheY-like chemotaxis protein